MNFAVILVELVHLTIAESREETFMWLQNHMKISLMDY